MSMDYIRKTYRLSVKRGDRVIYTGEGDDKPEYGTVTSAAGARLMIRLDGKIHALPFHPTWKLKVLA